MNFMGIMDGIGNVSLGFLFVGMVFFMMGMTSYEDWVGNVGYGMVIISILLLGTYYTLPDLLGKEEVRVVDVSESTGSTYVKAVVPKEDEDKIKSQQHSIVKLKDYYNDNYDGDKYLEEDEVVELYIDSTASYIVHDEDIRK